MKSFNQFKRSYFRTEKETREKMESRANTDYIRYLFNELYSRELTSAAQNNDIGHYVKECAGAFVNNTVEGRELTLRERIDYLKDKMTEKRAGNDSLAIWFSADWEAIKRFTREYTTE